MVFGDRAKFKVLLAPRSHALHGNEHQEALPRVSKIEAEPQRMHSQAPAWERETGKNQVGFNRSKARFNFKTLTPGSPKMPRKRLSVF